MRINKELKVLNPDERKFKGFLSVEVVDKQGEIIPIEEMEKVMDTIMKRGGFVIDSHSNRVVGKLLNWQKEDRKGKNGISVTGQVFNDYKADEDVWNKIKSGEYAGLSFGGSSGRKETGTVEGIPASKLSELEGYEVSLCEQPCNPEAVITEFNPLAKSDNRKARIYLRPDEEAPEGTRIVIGGRGGRYYETEGREKPEETRTERENEAQELWRTHIKTGEPLTEDEVDLVVSSGFAEYDDFDMRGGGMHWYSPKFPAKEKSFIKSDKDREKEIIEAFEELEDVSALLKKKKPKGTWGYGKPRKWKKPFSWGKEDLLTKIDLINKPFAGFENFNSCVVDMRRKGKTEESAHKICGFLQARAENKSKEETIKILKNMIEKDKEV